MKLEQNCWKFWTNTYIYIHIYIYIYIERETVYPSKDFRKFHAENISLNLKCPTHQALTLLGGARFITWHLRHLLLGKSQWCLRNFLCSPGMSGLWPCAWTHLKKGFVSHCSCRWDVWQIPRDSVYLSKAFRKIHAGNISVLICSGSDMYLSSP